MICGLAIILLMTGWSINIAKQAFSHSHYRCFMDSTGFAKWSFSAEQVDFIYFFDTDSWLLFMVILLWLERNLNGDEILGKTN